MKSKITPRQLNKSLDERLLKPTDLIDALNVAIRTNEDGQGGVVKNAEANTAVDFLGSDADAFPGSNYVIGSVSDDEVGVVYLFVYNSDSKHSIWAYSTESKSYRLIFTSSLLNFPKNGFVSADFVKIKRVVETAAISDSTQTDELGGNVDVAQGEVDDVIPNEESDDDEFETNFNVSGCTDPAALNYDPAATQDDESCVFATPFEIPYCIGVDFSTLANHIYGPFLGSGSFSGTSEASISLNEESPLLDSDPFKDGVDIENVVDRITCKIKFQQENGGLSSSNPYELDVEYATEDLVRETNLTSRSRGLQYSSQGVIVVDGSILDDAYRATAEITVTFKEAWANQMSNWLDEMLAQTGNAMWNKDLNASIPHEGRGTLQWTVEVFNGVERTDGAGNSIRLKDFINESPNYLITNAVGFKSLNGIKAGINADNFCLTTSMQNGQLIVSNNDIFVDGLTSNFDNDTDQFKGIGNILFPGLGFGCDTPHVSVMWGGNTRLAGNRGSEVMFISDFRHTPEWQDFEALFAEVEAEVSGEQEEQAEDDTAARNRDDEVPSNIYVFFTTNFNDPIYEESGFDGNALQQQINALYPSETQINYYGSATGEIPQSVNIGILNGYPGASINGVEIGSTEVGGTIAGDCNYFYFPLSQSTVLTDTNNAYRPTATVSTLDLKRVLGISNRTLPVSSTSFNYVINGFAYGAIDASTAATQESKLEAGGVYTKNLTIKLSGEGTLDFTNRVAVSIRQPSIEPANQQTGFYEFDAPLSESEVTGALYLQDLDGNFEDASEYLEVLGVGGGGNNEPGTLPQGLGLGALGGPGGISVVGNGRLYTINFRAYIKAIATYGDDFDHLRITNGLAPNNEGSNIKYLQATFSEDRETVDGVAVNEESTADPITLGDESVADDDGAADTSSSSDTNNTVRTATPAVTAPVTSKSSASTQKKAKNKYGY